MTEKPIVIEGATLTYIEKRRARRVSFKWGSSEIEMSVSANVVAGADIAKVEAGLDRILRETLSSQIEEEKAGLLAEGAAEAEIPVPEAAQAPSAPPKAAPREPDPQAKPGAIERILSVDAGSVIKHTVTPNGNHQCLVLVKPFDKRGLTAWPEPLDACPALEGWQEWPIGQPYSLQGAGIKKVILLTGEDGRSPQKVIRFEA